MARHDADTADEVHLFDPSFLNAGTMPHDLSLARGRLVFLWQSPSESALAELRTRYHDVPIVVGRFGSETAVHQARLPYFSPGDFFDYRSLIDLELAAMEARRTWTGVPEPEFRGMSLIDGDLVRSACRVELTACAAMLLAIRRANPRVELVTDWMGRALARSVGSRCRRWWRADLTDRNWPPRRTMRERGLAARDALPRRSGARANRVKQARAGGNRPDVVFLLGNWVEPRLLDCFPIEACVRQGLNCLLWVHCRSAALDALVERTSVRCEQIAFPEPARDAKAVAHHVAAWCRQAADAGYFAPLRGPAAQCLARLLGWPRWAPKLVAMHRLLSERLRAERPKLLLAPAEKDWSAYCGHHAARELGIETVAMPHGTWLPGSALEHLDDVHTLPTAARVVLGFTPEGGRRGGDAWLQRDQTVLYRGSPRLDRVRCDPARESGDPALRVLIGTMGVGPGRASSLRRWVGPHNRSLVGTLVDQLGDRVRVRLHPWDSPDDYPDEWRKWFLPIGDSLEAQLGEHAALVTAYSSISLDAAAVGRPVFLWDFDQMDLHRSEIARHGGAVVKRDLAALGKALHRFLNDERYRAELNERAARFPAYLREALPEPSSSGADALARWLATRVEGRAGESAVVGRGEPTPQLVTSVCER